MRAPTTPDDTRRFFGMFTLLTLLAHLILGVALGLMPAVVGLLLLCGLQLITLVRVRKSESLSVRRKASAAFFGALVGALAFGATVFAIYLGSYTFTRERCEAARSAPTLVERKATLTTIDDLDWLGWATGRLTGKGVFLFRCNGAKDDIRNLEEAGQCPWLPPTDAACRCGNEEWSGSSACRGRTTCERDSSGLHLRCEVSHYSAQ